MEVRSLFGDGVNRSDYLTHGSTNEDARQRLEDFHAFQKQAQPDAATSSLGLLIPTERDWREHSARLKALQDFPDGLRMALQQHGFSPNSFSAFFNAWQAAGDRVPSGDYESLATSVTAMLKGPLSMLGSTHAPHWFATFIEEESEREIPEELHTVSVKQLQTLNELFGRYRWSALKLSLIGLALVIASVFAIYPFRRGLRIALIPAGSCFFVFGLYGLTGQTLNLFHLLGAFLGVCLSHNYAIFSAENAGPNGAPPVAIRLSALSTATSFGVLAFSHIPVIHALGLTVAGIVVTALTAVELEPLARRHA
jgi:predicted exporter